MIENYNIAVDNQNEKKSTKHPFLITTLVYFIIYIILAASAVLFIIFNTPIVKRDSSTSISDDDITIKITFYNLKKDNKLETIKIEDFSYVIDSGKYLASNFEDGSTTFALLHNDTLKETTITFKNIYNSTKNKDAKVCYKGKEILSKTFDPVAEIKDNLIVLTIAVVLLYLFTLPIISISRPVNKKSETIKQTNSKAIEELKKHSFNISKTLCISTLISKTDDDLKKKTIYIDGKNKKFGFVDYEKNNLKIVDYKDLIDYKLIENNGVMIETKDDFLASLITQTNIQKTVNKDVCKKLQVVFVLNDENDTNITYNIIEKSVQINSELYKNISSSLIELTSFLDVIKSNTPKDKKFIYCRNCGVKNDANSSHCSSCKGALD